MDDNKPQFPHTVDATMLSTFRACPRKFELMYLRHWKPKAESVHLIAGGAFAAGVEAARKAYFVDNLPREECVQLGLKELMVKYGDFECPPESAKSMERTCGALEYYFTQYTLGEDGMTPILLGKDKHGIELAFCEPLNFPHPVTNSPILYTGRADMVANFAGGIYVVDEKTTTQLGASWSRQWELRSQFTGYQYACQKQGINAAGTVIRGVSILKTKYDTLQVMTYRPPWEIERWEKQLYKDLGRMLRAWKEDYWDYNLDHSCNDYAGCPFALICKSPTPEDWLEMYFEKRVWDPLARKQLTVEEYEAQWI